LNEKRLKITPSRPTIGDATMKYSSRSKTTNLPLNDCVWRKNIIYIIFSEEGGKGCIWKFFFWILWYTNLCNFSFAWQ